MTLPWLIGMLKISNPTEAELHEQQMAFAEGVTRRATVDAVAAFRDRQTEDGPRRVAEVMLTRVSMMQEAMTGANAADDEPVMIELAGEILAARRVAVVKARDDRRLDDEVMREVLEHMDFEEAAMVGRNSSSRG
jgi:CPA1 family monovalent cation:H+ antiporter